MKKIYLRIIFSGLTLFSLFLLIRPLTHSGTDLAFADQFDNEIVPYTKIFTISAYYSPLPCQNSYATGSYEGDITLNGRGTNGADGTEVYPGMIAAPKTYEFGTKMDIPGIGVVAVHDRGGAIKPSNGEEGVYDRLDIWMGYGDQGLKRALNWGRRTMDVVVYGVNDSIAEQIILDDYTDDEAIPNYCVIEEENTADSDDGGNEDIEEEKSYNNDDAPKVVKKAEVINETELLLQDLNFGDSGEEVKKLQRQLKQLNLFKADITGYYGEVTKHAVFKFQQIQNLVMDEDSAWAGKFGPKTRDRMNEIIASKNYTTVLIAEAALNKKEDKIADNKKKKYISSELEFGMSGGDVSKLQALLKDLGFFEGALVTEYFGPATMDAVIQFQLEHNIITSEDDTGAGRVGPTTLDLINSLS